MKTIKGAKGSKSVILRKLALPFLMLVAILGIEIGGGQTVPREKSPIGTDIGGNSALRNYAGVSAEIGGGQETRKSPIGPDIGGNSAPRNYASAEIGGSGNQSVPKNDNPLSGIGGSQTPPRSYTAVTEPIGGGLGGTEKRKEIKPYSPTALASGDVGGQNQQNSSGTNPLGITIGGQSAPRHVAIGDPIGTQGMETRNGKPFDFGGGQTSPRQIGFIEIGGNGGSLPPRSKPVDIGGGQNPPRSGLYISSFLQDCTVDIGGAQGPPRQLFDIGGNGSGSHNPRNFHQGLI